MKGWQRIPVEDREPRERATVSKREMSRTPNRGSSNQNGEIGLRGTT